MRRLSVLFVLAIALTSCSHTQPTTRNPENQKLSAPSECSSLPVLTSIKKIVPEAVYIPTNWQPVEGTDLEAALVAGGIACTYGIESAEIGGTLIWAPADQSQWDKRKELWLAGDFQQSKIEGFSDALILKDGVTGVDGAPRWNAIVYLEGFWISANLSFVQSLDQAKPILDAARESLVSN